MPHMVPQLGGSSHTASREHLKQIRICELAWLTLAATVRVNAAS